MWLRQVAMVSANLAEAERRLQELLNVDETYSDAGVAEFGLKNVVIPSGRSFVEVVSPSEEATAAGRMLDRRGGDCGYMLLFQVEDLGPVNDQILSRGLRKIWQTDRPEVSAFHVHPKDMGGAIVSFDEMRPVDEWIWAGPGWQGRRARETGDLLSCTLEVADPAQVAHLWADLLGTEPVGTKTGFCILMTDGAEVRFEAPVQSQPRGLVAFELAAAGSDQGGATNNRRSVQVCGVDVVIR